jgi:hypothetical protein
VAFTLGLVGYVYQHRKIKVFKVASPIFLCITLLGCVIMYLEVRFIRNLWFRTSASRIIASLCHINGVQQGNLRKTKITVLVFIVTAVMYMRNAC